MVDWLTGSRDDWPSLHKEDEIDIVSSSCLSVGFIPNQPPAIREMVVHLPPIPEDEISQIEPFWDSDRFLSGSRSVRFGLDSIATPHIIAERISFEEAQDIVSSSIECYEDIYMDEDLIVKEE